MKITRRSPRIRIGNTTYTFGKNGVSRSTRIAKGVRVRTSANGKQSIGGSFLWWRWSQDLDELGRKKTPEELKQIREQRKNDLSPSLLFTHPFVFFDHLFRRERNTNASSQQALPQKQNTSAPGKQPKQSNNSPNAKQPQQALPRTQVYSAQVTIYKEINGSLSKVTEGTLFLEYDKLVIKANVTKEILYKDVLDIYVDCGKVFISSKGRNIPMILELSNTKYFLTTLQEKIRQAK